MPSTFGIAIGHNIRHGYESSMSVRTIDGTVAPNGSPSRQVILNYDVDWEGTELPSYMEIQLYKPKELYVGADGQLHPIDVWGQYGISLHALPDPAMIGVNASEFHRGGLDFSSYDLTTKYLNRYWDSAPGGVRNDNVFSAPDNGGWEGDRAVHQFDYGFGFDGLELATRRLRVMTTVPGIAQKYVVAFRMFRGRRGLMHAIRFDLRGAESGNDLLSAAYIPIAIVYCPPGQDMTNSLKEIESHGTRFTFGTSDMQAAGDSMGISVSPRANYGYAGIEARIDETASDSQSVTDSSSTTIRIIKTQETTITANNQTAIGRARWGALGDLFVILKDMLFYVSALFDEQSGYALVPISVSPRTRKLVLSTYDLLRPLAGSEAEKIPWVQRKAILKLNPFVIKDEAVLDQVHAGALEPPSAVDPTADPNESNPTRAVKVLNYTPGPGAELTFYQSTGITIEREEAHAETYTTEFRSATSLGLDIGIPIVGIGYGADFTGSQTIHYQTTSELGQEIARIKAAQCYLIRNQNDPNTSPIDVYYDTVFGTFMFRTVEEHKDCVEVKGAAWYLQSKKKKPLRHTKVLAVAKDERTLAATFTDRFGHFYFPCLKVPDDLFEIWAGGKKQRIEIDRKKGRFIEVSIEEANPILDLTIASIGDIAELLEIPRSTILGRRDEILKADSFRELAKVLGRPLMDKDALRFEFAPAREAEAKSTLYERLNEFRKKRKKRRRGSEDST